MRRLSPLASLSILLGLALLLSALSAQAKEVQIYPGDDCIVNAGEVVIFELDPDFAWSIGIYPLVRGQINKGHVVMYALGNIVMPDNLRLGTLYKEVDGHEVLVMRCDEWNADNMLNLYRVVLQVFTGSMQIYFN